MQVLVLVQLFKLNDLNKTEMSAGLELVPN